MKKVAIGLAAAAVLVAGALLLAYHSLDVILKFALEHYGPEVLGASVKVGEVRLSAGTGEGSLKSLEIGSPRGFTSPRAALIYPVVFDPQLAGNLTLIIQGLVILFIGADVLVLAIWKRVRWRR